MIQFIKILIIIAMVFVFACNKKENTKIIENKTPTVTESQAEVIVEPVNQGPIFKTYTSIGTVIPKDSTRIFPKVAGRISDVLVEEGDQVKKETFLCR